MNSLSWFIYIAQVADSIGMLLIAIGTLIIGCVLLSFAVPRINAAMEDCDDYVGKPLKTNWLAVAAVLLLIGNLIPKKGTMYAIAASQLGERIASSETAKGITDDATKALQQWIKKQIEPENKK
jgi:hypothetical protein